MNLAEPNGQLTLHRFNGDEVYRLASAVMFVLNGTPEQPLDLWFEVTTDAEPLRSLPDTVGLRAHPNAEVFVNIPGLDLNALVGARFAVPCGRVADEESARATLYYCEHEDLDNNTIAILNRHGDTFRVRWCATTVDVNYYDGSKPDAGVVIEGDFTFLRSTAEVREYASRYC